MDRPNPNLSLAASLCWMALMAAPGVDAQVSQSSVNPAHVEADSLVDESRSLVAEWMALQKVISEENASWKASKTALEGRIELVKLELEDFESRIKSAQANIQEETVRKQKLTAEIESAQRAVAALAESAASLENQIKKLKPVLPPPVLAKVQSLYERMPEDPKNTKVSLAERYQNILGILNEADKANGEVFIVSQLLEFPGVQATEVQAVYVGLSQAYFINAERTLAGVGQPVEGGWKWEQSKELVHAVEELIAVIDTKVKPRFVFLPAQIK